MVKLCNEKRCHDAMKFARTGPLCCDTTTVAARVSGSAGHKDQDLSGMELRSAVVLLVITVQSSHGDVFALQLELTGLVMSWFQSCDHTESRQVS